MTMFISNMLVITSECKGLILLRFKNNLNICVPVYVQRNILGMKNSSVIKWNEISIWKTNNLMKETIIKQATTVSK